MIERLRDSRGWQLLTITTLILIVPLMVDLNGRIGVLQRMQQRKSLLRQELDELEAERDTLKAEYEFVAGDAYLEQWARVDGRMTRPGEVPIIPVYLEKGQPEISAIEARHDTADAPLSVSEQWRRLFFDENTSP